MKKKKDFENCFELLGIKYTGEEEIDLFDQRTKQAVKATRALLKAIEKFRREVRSIDNKYPKSGIGDTATDEAIVNYVYSEIH